MVLIAAITRKGLWIVEIQFFVENPQGVLRSIAKENELDLGNYQYGRRKEVRFTHVFLKLSTDPG